MLADWQRNYQRAGAYELTFEKPLDELELEGGQHGYGRRQVAPAEVLAALETAGQLLAALAQLPLYEQRIVLWKVSQGLKFTEIAARLLLSDDAVQRSLKRAMADLRRQCASSPSRSQPGAGSRAAFVAAVTCGSLAACGRPIATVMTWLRRPAARRAPRLAGNRRGPL